MFINSGKLKCFWSVVFIHKSNKRRSEYYRILEANAEALHEVDSGVTVEVCTPIETTLTTMSSPYRTSVIAAQHKNNTINRFRIITLVVFCLNFSTINGLMSNRESEELPYQ